ncbi:MAG: SRPBCC family protein [Alphaproteobacteria bacterium]|nr:SRPBCC family protein [Alphaproteobacteria bacterium]
MTRTITHQPDPDLDLVLERVVDVPPNLVWAAWTRPEYLKKWFTPAPWQTVDCEVDLHPGGIFRFVMRSPEGQEFPNVGCYLEVIENEKLVWTAALKPGYRPQTATGNLPFTAVILLEPHGAGTKYTAIAIHGDRDGAQKHAKMGFHDGWGKALDQLVRLAKTM